jgi:hypothetical protein
MTADITDRLDAIERLADDVSPYDHGDDTAPLHDAVPELVAAVRAVLELHRRYDMGRLPAVCAQDSDPWPCSTVHALAAALAPQPRPEGTQR